MRREIYDFPDCRIHSCCPGHDKWPSYKRYGKKTRSRKNRALMKAMEHRYVRRRKKQELDAEAHC